MERAVASPGVVSRDTCRSPQYRKSGTVQGDVAFWPAKLHCASWQQGLARDSPTSSVGLCPAMPPCLSRLQDWVQINLPSVAKFVPHLSVEPANLPCLRTMSRSTSATSMDTQPNLLPDQC